MSVVGAQCGWYPLRMALAYSAKEHSGKSCTERINSEVVSFLCDGGFEAGSAIQLIIDWPTTHDGQPMELVIQGRVLENIESMKTAQIIRYEFRDRVYSETCAAIG